MYKLSGAEQEILLHPMIREVAVEELEPSARNYSVLLNSLQEISLMHGLDFMKESWNCRCKNRLLDTSRNPRKSSQTGTMKDKVKSREKRKKSDGSVSDNQRII